MISQYIDASIPSIIYFVNEPVFLPMIALVGWLAGQLVNYLADQLPVTRSLSTPICQTCGQVISPSRFILFPLVRSNCGHTRSRRTWLVVMGSVVAACWLWISPPDRLGFLAGFTLLVYMTLVVVIDVEHKLILHPISLAGVLVCGAIGFDLWGPWMSLAGGLAGFLMMLIFYWFGALFARWLTKRRGLPEDEVALGFGDVNLSGVLGLLLGWPVIVGGLIVAILLAGLCSLVYIVWMLIFKRYQSFVAIPYGPFLILAAFILLYL
jgi:leader peptidase (prepilin peptidase) / N-methyltransferase